MSDKENLYARWISGEISPEEEQALKASGEWEELQAITDATDALTLPKYDKAKGFEQLKKSRQSSTTQATSEPKQEAKVRRLNLFPILAAAASILLLIGAFFFLRESSTSISAPNEQNKKHLLSDNSTVLLNDGSSITYTKDRTIELTGEAFFEVEKGSPFMVNTPNGIIEVLGTSFNVRAWGENLYVECYTGKVKVSNGSSESTLTKGQSVNVVNGDMKATQSFNHEKPLWSTATSRFYEEDLNVVFEELVRQYNITVKTPVFQKPFSGSFTHQSLKDALDQICKPMSLNYHIETNGKVVLISQ